MSHAKRTASPARTVGAACALLLLQRRSRHNRPVGRTACSRKTFRVARVSAQEHMAKHKAPESICGKVTNDRAVTFRHFPSA